MDSYKLLLFCHRNLNRNTTQTAVINIFKIRILLNLTLRMFVHIHFQKYNRYYYFCSINSFPKTVTVILLKMYVDKQTSDNKQFIEDGDIFTLYSLVYLKAEWRNKVGVGGGGGGAQPCGRLCFGLCTQTMQSLTCYPNTQRVSQLSL